MVPHHQTSSVVVLAHRVHRLSWFSSLCCMPLLVFTVKTIATPWKIRIDMENHHVVQVPSGN